MTKKVLTKAEIVQSVQSRMGLPRKVTAEVVDNLLEIIKGALETGEDVKISGFGNLEVKEKNARPGRNPQTGEEMIIPARRVLSFKPSSVLRKAINSKGFGED